MKEAVIYKILRYRQNRCHTNEERWIDHSWHKAKIQHPQQCQSVFTVESQDNIPDCTNTHIIKTTLPIYLPGVKKLRHNINTHRSCAPKTIKLFGSFFTPGRYIGSVVFMMWVLVQSGMLSCDSTVNTDWQCDIYVFITSFYHCSYQNVFFENKIHSLFNNNNNNNFIVK
jgi:hypothetical protein